MDLKPAREAELLAADAIGDVIEHWGFRKSLGRTWTVLYLSGEALPAQVLVDRLAVSSGSMSTTLTELQRWGVVRRVWRPGERRDFFEAETDFWKMISKVVQERERFLAGSVRERLERAQDALRRSGSTAEVRAKVDRLGKLLSFAAMAEKVISGFLSSRRADFSAFGDLLQLGRVASLRGRHS